MARLSRMSSGSATKETAHPISDALRKSAGPRNRLQQCVLVEPELHDLLVERAPPDPEGFGHGFCTLAPETVVAYKASGFYDQPSERAVIFFIALPQLPDVSTLSFEEVKSSLFYILC